MKLTLTLVTVLVIATASCYGFSTPAKTALHDSVRSSLLSGVSPNDMDVSLLMADYATAYNLPLSSLSSSVFKANLARLASLMARESAEGATYGVNGLFHLSADSFLAKFTSPRPTPSSSSSSSSAAAAPPSPTPGTLPESFDWRKEGIVTPVEELNTECTAVWALVPASVASSAAALKRVRDGKPADPVPLSWGEAAECTVPAFSCDGGGIPGYTFDAIAKYGLATAKAYPNPTSELGPCRAKEVPSVAEFGAPFNVTTGGNEPALLASIAAFGTISSDVYVSVDWQLYTGGILKADECKTPRYLNSVVELVGWTGVTDVTKTNGAYIAKNSWGVDWGMDGYIELEYGANTCLLTDVCMTIQSTKA